MYLWAPLVNNTAHYNVDQKKTGQTRAVCRLQYRTLTESTIVHSLDRVNHCTQPWQSQPFYKVNYCTDTWQSQPLYTALTMSTILQSQLVYRYLTDSTIVQSLDRVNHCTKPWQSQPFWLWAGLPWRKLSWKWDTLCRSRCGKTYTVSFTDPLLRFSFECESERGRWKVEGERQRTRTRTRKLYFTRIVV